MSFHYCRWQTWEHFNPEGIHINLYKTAEILFFLGGWVSGVGGGGDSLLIYVQYWRISSQSISRVVLRNVLTYLISSLFTICQAQSHNAL